MNIWHNISPKRISAEDFVAVVEIPKGSKIKYELDKETGLESKPVKILCIGCLAVATIICFAYGGSPTQLIFIANVATSIATPVAGLFMILMLWKKELFMGTKAPRVLQVSMTICYIFALYMTVTALKTQIPNLIHSFMG